MNIKLTQEQRDKLKQLHRKCTKRKHADKLKALLLLDDGFSCVEVGHILLLDDDAVRKYRNQYLNHGANSLLEDHNKETSSYLNEVELESLDKHLQTYTYSDSKGIINWIEQQFRITYTPSGINSLLQRIGFCL